jgi:CTP:molybdopterin cytidylyltransferase MocA
MGKYAELVVEVEMTADGVIIDIDTPEALYSLTSQKN